MIIYLEFKQHVNKLHRCIKMAECKRVSLSYLGIRKEVKNCSLRFRDLKGKSTLRLMSFKIKNYI